MILALLALTIMWSPVLVDCFGNEESGVMYEVSYLYRECHEIPGCVECDGCPGCVECSTFAVRLETPDTRWDTEIGSDPPARGAAYFFEVRDHDAVGQWSDECL